LAKARVRGVYSTALTKILIDNGFEIVQPSVTIQKRFGLKDSEEPPDIDIYDKPNRQGVHVLGTAEPFEAFISVLKDLLDDMVVRRWKVAPEGIYKGLVKNIEPATNSVLVDIGPASGKIGGMELSDQSQKEVLVQVEGIKAGTRELFLTTKIRIPGKYAVLILGGKVKVSRKIRDSQTRLRLQRLGEELADENWGIIWRTASASQPPETLRNEALSLIEQGKALLQKAKQVEAPAGLWEEMKLADLEFPALSKKKLDEIRGAVVPTLDGHHLYKACRGRVSSALDMAERLLEKGCSYGDVEELFKQTVEPEYPVEGSIIDIQHVKLDGKIFHLGPAQIEAFNSGESSIRLRRVFERAGIYDGLRTCKEPGDYAITEAKLGEWHFKTQYFSKDAQSKGTYINLNTPIELYPRKIRYVDLEVDICIWPDGKTKILDEEKLEDAFAQGLITKKLTEIVKEKMQSITKTMASV
jgi:Ribonuclease G/E